MVFTLKVNGVPREVDVDDDTPLVWVLRDELGLTGTKFGCGISQCGACTVHLNGQATKSCQFPAKAAAPFEITTIEGLAPDHPVKRAWIAEEVPQCGYCQPGMIMAASALLARKPNPTDQDVSAALATNLCRCGTYNRVRRAIRRAAAGGGGAP